MAVYSLLKTMFYVRENFSTSVAFGNMFMQLIWLSETLSSQQHQQHLWLSGKIAEIRKHFHWSD
jgi:hypothetical protein